MDNVLTVKNKTILDALQNHNDGDVAYCEDEQTYMIYKNGKWIPVEATMTNDGLQINLYDLNKQIIAQLPPLDEEKINEFKDTIKFFKDKDSTSDYFLLYGREINYFTLFHKTENCKDNFENLVIECLKGIGIIQSIELNEDVNAFEFWVKNETSGEVTLLMLFNYNDGVVEYG